MNNVFDAESLILLKDIASEEQRAVKLLRLAHNIITQCRQEGRPSSLCEDSAVDRITQWLASQGIILKGSGEKE
jgi:hypothetical protein